MPSRTQDKSLREIKRVLKSEGPVTRKEIGERLRSAGIDLNSQTRLHILLTAVTSGIACMGPDQGRSTCLVLREEWLGKQPRFDRDTALAELARRYLRAFGPAGEADFASWAGLGLTEVRSGLDAIAAELDESRLDDQMLFSLKSERARIPPTGQIRLLGAFDTYMLGYRSRDFAVPADGMAAVKEGGGGWIRPVIVEDGRVIGTWRGARKGGRLEIALNPFDRLSAEKRVSIDAEVEDIGRFENRAATVAPTGGG